MHFFEIILLNLATDFEGTGVWLHDNDESLELTWINHKWNCAEGGRDELYTHGGNAILLGIVKGFGNAAWCDWDSTANYRFICEGSIQ